MKYKMKILKSYKKQYKKLIKKLTKHKLKVLKRFKKSFRKTYNNPIKIIEYNIKTHYLQYKIHINIKKT